EFLAKLINSAVKAGLEFVRTIAEAAMAAIEAMMKAALQAFIYLRLGEFLFLIYIAFFLLDSLNEMFKNKNLSIHETDIIINFSNSYFILNLNIIWRYNISLDIKIPFLKTTLKWNDIIIIGLVSGIIFNLNIISYEFIQYEDISEELFNNTDIINSGIFGFNSGLYISLSSLQIFFQILINRINFLKYIVLSSAILFIGTAIQIWIWYKNNYFNLLMFGMSIAYFFSFIVLIILGKYHKKYEYEDYEKFSYSILGIIKNLLLFFIIQIFFDQITKILIELNIITDDFLTTFGKIIYTVSISIWSLNLLSTYINCARWLSSFANKLVYGAEPLSKSLMILKIFYLIIAIISVLWSVDVIS
ncbi:MAG: hypothetical protein ACTSRP_11215, partial [Candidatus Helarchaeota archaeon]